MLFGEQRTKDKTIIGVIVLLVMLFIIALIYRNYMKSNTYEEQTVMAEEYLQEGKYEKAVKAYKKALSMSENDQEVISIRLADAYIGLNEYEKALEVLRFSYNKTAGITVKEKIEEVTALKTEYQFGQLISRANTYFLNKEYDKAIAEFSKAKLIKSKDIITYNGIAKSYIEKGEYQKARDEVVAGLQLTQSDELNKTLNLVDTYIMKERYDIIVKAAFEYIYQENYNESIAKFTEAIKLKPDEDQAYYGLAELYISLKDYEKAITLLENTPDNLHSDSLTSLLEQAVELNNKEIEYKEFLSELYYVVTQLDIPKIIEMITLPMYEEVITEDKLIFYTNTEADKRVAETGMIIYDGNRIYAGGLQDKTRAGIGIYLVIYQKEGDMDYYYYEGEWYNNLPHGFGQTVEVTTEASKEGEKVVHKLVTNGYFDQSLESGSMIKYFYMNDTIVGNTTYVANNGIPNPIYDRNNNKIENYINSEYAIGIWNNGNEPTAEYYYVPSGTLWGVKSLTSE